MGTHRIRRLRPAFEGARITLPPSRHRTLYDKRTVDLMDVFIEERVPPCSEGNS
jgi:hypothetical protein